MANPLTKIPKFRRCVLQNFPFIEQDFDALTDYQLLCKVVEYLNKVITSQNAVIDVAESLTTAFNELQSFVANYFANLDVQEEINNKLDQMAEDGTLQEIITAYIQANVAWAFDTVADMQAATNLVNGSYAQTLGYHTLNDGGGALYKITNTGTADGGNTIAIGNLFAHLIKLNPNIKQYGAYGDNTHDDSAAIQLAIDSNTDGVLVFNEGDYLCTSTIEVSENIDIRGCNAIIHSTAQTGMLIGNEAKVIEVCIDKITVTKDEYSASPVSYGFRFIRCYESVFSELCAENFVYNFYINPQTSGFAYNVFREPMAVNGSINLLIEANTSTGGYANQNIFYGGRFYTRDHTVYNIKLANGDSNSFYTPCVEGTGTHAILCNGSSNVFEYPRTEGTWSDGYGVVFDTNSRDNRLYGLRYDLHINDLGTNNSWWNQYDGLRVCCARINGNVGSFIRSANSSSNNHVPVLSVEDQGAQGTTTLINITEKDTNVNHRPIKLQTKEGEEKMYVDGYGNIHAKNALAVITPLGHILPIQIGSSGLYYQNNILWSTYLGDKTDAVAVGHDYKTYAGDPNSHVTPQYIGQECLDTTNNAWYKATSLTNSSWAKLTA